ncbi:MAG: BatA domain-containing protein [Pirellulales bacterium]
MNFLHLSMLAGLAAMVIPVALHLLSRRQPKPVTFPALRFVKHTVLQQRSSWQLRHFLLLLLRVAIFGALALALARPRVHSAMLGTAVGVTIVAAFAVFASVVTLTAIVTRRGTSVWIPSLAISIALWVAFALWASVSVMQGPVVPSSDQSAPVAAVLIVDTGPSMEYRSDNAQRIAAAKEMAGWILGKLPIDSRVGILSAAPMAGLSLDPATAKGQIDVLQNQSAHVDLVSRIQTAIELVRAADLQRKEVYVLTDMMSSSWQGDAPKLAESLKEHPGEVLIQIIDVGVDAPINYQLGDLKSDLHNLPVGSEAEWQVTVERTPTTPGSMVDVELLHEDIDPKLPVIRDGNLETPNARVVDRKQVDLTRDTSALISLKSPLESDGNHNFIFRLKTADPLESDNTRTAVVAVQAQQSTLIVADNADAGRLMRLIVNPTDSAAGGSNDGTSVTQQVRFAQLSQVPLERFKVICLVDPPPLSPGVTAALEQHVNQGGGLLLTLGPSLGTPEDAAKSAFAKLLPGSPARIGRKPVSDRSTFLNSSSAVHPLFHVFGPVASDVPWNRFPIFKHWELDALAADAQVLMSTSDRSVASVILQHRGSGQILTVTTPIPAVSEAGQPAWNELTAGSDPWPAFGLMLGAVRVLSEQSGARYNYAVGESASLPNDSKIYPSTYDLFTPTGRTRRVQANDGLLNVGMLEQAGLYRMRGSQGGLIARSVSAMTPAEDTQLVRLDPARLDVLLGTGNYKRARNKSEIESSVGQARYGRELFPLMMLVTACLFLAEQAMSNRFYSLRLSSTGRAA